MGCQMRFSDTSRCAVNGRRLHRDTAGEWATGHWPTLLVRDSVGSIFLLKVDKVLQGRDKLVTTGESQLRNLAGAKMAI